MSVWIIFLFGFGAGLAFGASVTIALIWHMTGSDD